MRNAYINLLLATFATLGVSAQNWQAQYGDSTNGNHVFKVCRQTQDGGFIFGGRQIDGNSTDDFYIVRTDADGNQLWDDSFPTSGYQDCRDLIQTMDGGFVISGITSSGSSRIIKYDALGGIEWDVPHPGGGDTYSLIELADSSIVAWGAASGSGSNGDHDGSLVKFDSQGNQVWHRYHGSAGTDQGRGILLDDDGGLILSGYKTVNGRDLWILKVDALGYEVWSNTIDWFAGATPTSISVLATTDNGFMLCGMPNDSARPRLYKLDSLGNEQWNTTIGEPGDNFLRNSLIHDHGNGYLMAGTSDRFGNGSMDVVMVRIDENGIDHLYHPFGGAYDDYGKSIRTTDDGGYIIAGYTSSFNPDTNLIEAYAIKIGPGDLPCAETSIDPTICGGEDFTVGTSTYNTTGVYVDTLTNIAGCDSIVTTDLTVQDSIFHFYPTICNGEFFVVSSATYTQTGDYTAYFTSGMGCDSTVITHLTVLDPIITEMDVEICDGESFSVGTGTFTTTGTHQQILGAANGCDSIVMVNLMVHPTYDTTISATICDGEVFSVGTYTHTETGTYVDQLYAMGMCDSIVTVNLTVLPAPDTTLYASICEGDVFSVGTSTYTLPGTYVDHLESSQFCDSVITSIITWDLPTDNLGNPTVNIVGNVFGDMDGACLFDGLDVPLPNWIVEADDGSVPWYGATNINGQYQLQLPFGTYDVSTQTPANWVNCGPSSQSVVVDSTLGCYETVDFPLVPQFDCAILDLDLSTVCLVPCSTSTYHLNYTNIGTQTAYSPTLSFISGQHITVNSSSIPWVMPQLGPVYFFQLDSIPAGASGTITIDVTVDCDTALIGHSVCSATWHDPTQNCSGYAQYNGAEIEVEGECLNGDSIEFRITNSGGTNMSGSLDYVILQDDIVYLDGSFQLNDGETETITLNSTGHTYRLEAQQIPLHPFATDPVSVVVEGCASGSQASISIGFADILENGDPIPFFDLDCSVIVPDCSGNIMNGSPKGIGPEKFISPDDELEYVITFKNEGAGPVSDIIIRDELSPHLDPMSVVSPDGSHDFEFEMTDNGMIEFRMQNIDLSDQPDENTGFVKFTVSLVDDVDYGTQIRNDAEIHYDSEMELTNETIHTVGERGVDYLIPLSVEDLCNPAHQLRVFPNPFSNTTTIELIGMEGEQVQIEIMDMNGSIVQRTTAQGQLIQISREGLPDGVYLYRVKTDIETIGAGTLVVGGK